MYKSCVLTVVVCCCYAGYTKLPFKWFDYLREAGSAAAPVKLFNKVGFICGFSSVFVFSMTLVFKICSCTSDFRNLAYIILSFTFIGFHRRFPITVSGKAWSWRLSTSWSHGWCALPQWRGLCIGYWGSTSTAGRMSMTSGWTVSLLTSTRWAGVSWQATSSSLPPHRVRTWYSSI